MLMKAIIPAVLAASLFVAASGSWAQAPNPSPAPAPAPATASASEPLTEAKKANIKKLLELTGVRAIPEQLANSTVQSMSGGIRQLDPKFPDRGFLIMRDAILSGLNAKVDSAGGLLDQVTQVYHNHFTANEIAEILKFYESPTGKKVIGQQGKVNSETFQVAMRWADAMGAELDQRIDAALKKENIKLPDPPKQGAAPKAAPRVPAKEAPKKQ
jgi:Uncharacterized protein conserved in bacteria (DUF2059).